MSSSVEDMQYGKGSGLSGTAGEVASQAQEKVSEVADQARERASELKDQGGSLLRSKIDDGSTLAGTQVRSNASDLKTVGEELRKQGKETPAKVAEQIADRGERIGSYLENSDGQQILSDVEAFARKQPWAVLAGGMAIGFMASRFLKASSAARYGSRVSVRSSGDLRAQLEASPNVTPPSSTPVSNFSASPVSEGL